MAIEPTGHVGHWRNAGGCGGGDVRRLGSIVPAALEARQSAARRRNCGRRIRVVIRTSHAPGASSGDRRIGGTCVAVAIGSMNIVILYLLLLKATATSFSGLTSLPVVRNDFVVHRQVLTDRQLNAAVVAGRTVPGPNGLYIVSVGYFIAGIPGACAGWLALVSPAFVMIPLLRYVGARAERPAIRSAIQALTLAAAGLIASATIPLARDALHGPVSLAIAV